MRCGAGRLEVLPRPGAGRCRVEFTALHGFRERLLAGGAERVIFDRLVVRLKERRLQGG
jgi:hypothetical protein